MGLDMFLQVLRPFEGLAAEIASMRLQGYVDANVRGYVVAFHDGHAAATPVASEVEVVSTLTSNVGFANMFLQDVSVQTRWCDVG